MFSSHKACLSLVWIYLSYEEASARLSFVTGNYQFIYLGEEKYDYMGAIQACQELGKYPFFFKRLEVSAKLIGWLHKIDPGKLPFEATKFPF